MKSKICLLEHRF